jgi:hypothetical protein
MDKVELISKIFEVCIFPLLAVLTAYIVRIIQIKIEDLKEKSENELLDKYIGMLGDTVVNCVLAVNQTYVDTLKKKGEFTVEAQKEAFNMVYQQVMHTLSDEAKVYLEEVYSDLDEFIRILIEATVRENKITVDG